MTSSSDKINIGIGSDAWSTIEESEYDEESKLAVLNLMEDIKWDKLIKICSDHRHGIPCQLSENFTFGTNNVVGQINFNDGQRWIARFLLPQEQSPSPVKLSDMMSSEVAAMRYLK